MAHPWAWPDSVGRRPTWGCGAGPDLERRPSREEGLALGLAQDTAHVRWRRALVISLNRRSSEAMAGAPAAIHGDGGRREAGDRWGRRIWSGGGRIGLRGPIPGEGEG